MPVKSNNLGIIKRRLFLFARKRFIGYSIVGTLVMVLGFAVLAILVEVVHVDKLIAGVLTMVFSVELNFVLNWRINWGDRGTRFIIAWPAFHATRIPLIFFNQALYTTLVVAGVWYMGATGVTAALSIVWNYYLNDKVAFRKHTDKDTVRPLGVKAIDSLYLPSISVVIPVGGNRTKSCEQLLNCVGSILNQDYAGEIEIILVVDSNNAQVKLLANDLPTGSVRVLEYTRPTGFVGRDKNDRCIFGWKHATGDILASTGVLAQWKSSNAATAVELMQTEGVEAVDGIGKRALDDDSFVGLFRDKALISEFAPFKNDFRLTPDTMAEDSHLPIYLTFFMTRAYFDRVKDSLPNSGCEDWDDFRTASVMVETGGAIYCTNKLVAYMLYGSSLRMCKQFASGFSGATYSWEHPNCAYGRKRLIQTVLTATALMLAALSTAVLTALYGLLGLGFCLYALLVGFVLTGIVNIVTAKDWRAFFFPPITFAQVSIWTFGALYASISEELDEEFLSIFRRHR